MAELAQFPRESDEGGSFRRQSSRFRDRVSADASSGFKAEPGRYHLYVSHACPWAHRTTVVRILKRLEDVVGLSVVDPLRGEDGWRLGEGADPVNGFAFLREAYLAMDPAHASRVTVPVLWDKREGVIVNNESSEILRMLNSEFNEWGDATVDLYPEESRAEIDSLNELIYDNINNGVYRAGFATTQEAYERAVRPLFATLEILEKRLSTRRFLLGDRQTEADWRLFTTLVRFDAVYHGHFKCNLKRIADYPQLSGYMRELCQQEGIGATVNFDHIKRHYYVTHRAINPTGVVPIGPELNLGAPHGRGC